MGAKFAKTTETKKGFEGGAAYPIRNMYLCLVFYLGKVYTKIGSTCCWQGSYIIPVLAGEGPHPIGKSPILLGGYSSLRLPRSWSGVIPFPCW